MAGTCNIQTNNRAQNLVKNGKIWTNPKLWSRLHTLENCMLVIRVRQRQP